MRAFDKIIIGAGLYGMYAALKCAKKKERIIVLEREAQPFMRATYVNQARVHYGYHYPRSLATAAKSAGYFERFNKDFGFCINSSFKQIYATSSRFSWSDAAQFKQFCQNASIQCTELKPEVYFNRGMCDGAFLTKEYSYDAQTLKEWFAEQLKGFKNAEMRFEECVIAIERRKNRFAVITQNGEEYEAEFVLNASYASANQILEMAGFDKFKIKYELCEIILIKPNEKLKEYGFTVMDGPFFSIMPFGCGSFHSLTAVTFTPHEACHAELPVFSCQKNAGNYCSFKSLGNCNLCPAKPLSAFAYMAGLARKYLKSEYDFSYKESLFSMKPILESSEVDDSRPTVVRVCSKKPAFISVLSGKINTVYDLDEVLKND